jgi:hypothetical protein
MCARAVPTPPAAPRPQGKSQADVEKEQEQMLMKKYGGLKPKQKLLQQVGGHDARRACAMGRRRRPAQERSVDFPAPDGALGRPAAAATVLATRCPPTAPGGCDQPRAIGGGERRRPSSAERSAR